MLKLEIRLRDRCCPSMSFADMHKGDVGRIVTFDSPYSGQIVMRTYNGVISFSEPGACWGFDNTHRVELLEPGTQLILTVS